MTGRRVALVIALCVAGAPSAAQAQEGDARALFQRGVQLLEDARFAEAASSLERSLAVREVPPVLYNLALAYRGVGAYLRAIETFERFLAVAGPREPLRRDATTIIGDLRAAIGGVRLVVRGAPTEVRVDERVIGSADLDTTLRLDPGRHVFEARRAGHRPTLRALTLAPGASAEVTLDAAESPLPATLEVTVNVDAATVVVDGRPRGRERFELAPGVHVLEVSAPGHVGDHRELDLAPGRDEHVVVTLANRPSVLTRWWFWTGAAVVVTGLVVGGVVLLSGTEDPVPGTWGTAYGAVMSW
ncbi:MAG: hypothetical protein Q8S73_30475 [Deltaproteobacteria bacterium]|nr:hypothetical protein [Myxococcales bacterium]MDP3218470.1 hypothetical protein [Deltaproteobacteria bacterium]